MRHGEVSEVYETRSGLFERHAHYRNNGAKVLARGEFGDHATVACMGGDLRSYYRRQDAGTVFDYCGGGFIAGGFDA